MLDHLQKTLDAQQVIFGRSGGIGTSAESAQIPSNSSPAALAAARILGHTLVSRPAIQDLIRSAPTTGDSEMNVVRDCIKENPMASERLDILTRLLQRQWEQQQVLAPDTSRDRGGAFQVTNHHYTPQSRLNGPAYIDNT